MIRRNILMHASSARSCLASIRPCTSSSSPRHDISTEPHVPVLKKEVVHCLAPSPGKLFIDMTFGAGGHSKALLEECSDLKLICLDRDSSASKYAGRLRQQFGKDCLRFFQGTFTDFLAILDKSSIASHGIADGVLFDAGASSMQFDDARRGFSLNRKSPLDMRMNPEAGGPTAADVLNKLDEKDLQRILKLYGEEKRAKAIAKAIVETRQMLGPFVHTRQLQDLIRDVYSDRETPVDKLGRPRHAATLTFQALRIFVNDELNQLYNGLKIAHRLLKPYGKCVVITFHSLEHKIVYQSFQADDARMKDRPICDDPTNYRFPWLSASDSIMCSKQEALDNPRARSAQLRVAQKQPVFL